MPDALSLSRSELPEEIATAIEELCDWEHRVGAAYSRSSAELEVLVEKANAANDALTAAILSRLREAEAQIRTQAMEQLAADAGWELDWDRVQAERDALTAKVLGMQPALTVALARVERLEKALKPFAEAADNLEGNEREDQHLWESPEAMMLSVGDLRAARSALTEAGRLAIKDA